MALRSLFQNFYAFNEIAEVNPSRTIKKGTITKYVSMESVEPRHKHVSKIEYRKYNGGSKFQNNDVLLARITPSLEHGKTCIVDFLEEGMIGAGSTEFIVISSRDGITLPDYIYYLTTSDLVREPAIKSMTGTSGRQRVDLNTFNSMLVPIPPISEQKAIAKILSDLDSKIELNEKMNKTLEVIAQAIFKHWFIDFEFPDENGKPYKSSGREMVNSELGKIPKGWEIGTLGDHIVFTKGKKSIELQPNENLKLIPIISMEMLENGQCKFGVPMNMKIATKYDPIMVMDGASSGRVEIGFEGIIGSTFASITPNDNILSSFYLFGLLKYLEKVLRENTTGTSIPHADKNRINKMQFLVPIKHIILKFDNIERAIIDKLSFNRNEIKNLIRIKELLLPKLMTGKIRVPLEDEHE